MFIEDPSSLRLFFSAVGIGANVVGAMMLLTLKEVNFHNDLSTQALKSSAYRNFQALQLLLRGLAILAIWGMATLPAPELLKGGLMGFFAFPTLFVWIAPERANVVFRVAVFALGMGLALTLFGFTGPIHVLYFVAAFMAPFVLLYGYLAYKTVVIDS